MTLKEQLRVAEAAMKDDHYQHMQAECSALEADYIRIMNSLSKQDQELLERYISCCEQMEFRRTCLAYHMIPTKMDSLL